VGVARALEACGAPELKVKWPNDILANTQDGLAKLAGILIEIAPAGSGPVPVVIGIGINVSSLDTAMEQPTTSLADLDVILPRHIILSRLLGELAPLLRRYESTGFVAYREEWNRRHAFADQCITMSSEHQETRHGIAIGADRDGALVVDGPDGQTRIVGGDISVRQAMKRPAT